MGGGDGPSRNTEGLQHQVWTESPELVLKVGQHANIDAHTRSRFLMNRSYVHLVWAMLLALTLQGCDGAGSSTDAGDAPDGAPSNEPFLEYPDSDDSGSNLAQLSGRLRVREGCVVVVRDGYASSLAFVAGSARWDESARTLFVGSDEFVEGDWVEGTGGVAAGEVNSNCAAFELFYVSPAGLRAVPREGS